MLRHNQKNKSSSSNSTDISLDAALFQSISDEQAESVKGGWNFYNPSLRLGGVKPPFSADD